MPRFAVLRAVLVLVVALGRVHAQPTDPLLQAGPLDNGKMWTFENPPLAYLDSTYNFEPDSAWFAKARLGSLRLPGCSASFVSPNGLIITNHHCIRSNVAQVSQPGENLLDRGFVAFDLDDERRVEGLYVDQLVAIADVTTEVEAALAEAPRNAVASEVIEQATTAIEERMLAALGSEAHRHKVEVVGLYSGGRYSAYTFRRYSDLRLAMAPELLLGFFGGDYDNFTYPRYALDFGLLRAYDTDDTPLETPHYFPLSKDGVAEGELIFVVGNPGSTSRQKTMAQLAFIRDISNVGLMDFLDSRIHTLDAFLADHPTDDAARNARSSLDNSRKATIGRQAALRDPVVLARRADYEAQFRADGAADVLDRMAAVQAQKRAYADGYRTFRAFGSSAYSSSYLLRGLAAAQGNTDRLRSFENRAEVIDRGYLTDEVAALRGYLDAIGQPLPPALQGPDAATVAQRIIDSTAFRDAAATRALLASGTALPADDPVVVLGATALQAVQAFYAATDALDEQEAALEREIGRTRFDLYGTRVPPDATFSPRFTDGVVQGYAYNGTEAPPFTSLYGLYDRHYSFGADSDWNLPERWLPAPSGLNLGTPLNFASTSDTIGGNSGSPAVNRNLELVGINFDRTIEGLLRDYIYLPQRGRNVMVDVRAVRESLRAVYSADRLLLELNTGDLVETEVEAEAAM